MMDAQSQMLKWFYNLRLGLITATTILCTSLLLRGALWLADVIVPAPVEAHVLQTPVVAAPTPTPTAMLPAPVIPSPEAPVQEPEATPEITPEPPTLHLPLVIARIHGVNVRSGPSTYYDKLGFLEAGQQALVTGYFGGWWRIDYNGVPAWVSMEVVQAVNIEDTPEVQVTLPIIAHNPPVVPLPAAPAAIQETRWIDVDLSEQRLTAYENGEPVKSYLVSTGLARTPTPVGQFRIWIKLRTDDMSGPGYDIKDVPWVMYFYRGYGLHGVTWHANFGHPMSHGCVNQPNEMAEWLFNFAEVGTLVNIHD